MALRERPSILAVTAGAPINVTAVSVLRLTSPQSCG